MLSEADTGVERSAICVRQCHRIPPQQHKAQKRLLHSHPSFLLQIPTSWCLQRAHPDSPFNQCDTMTAPNTPANIAYGAVTVFSSVDEAQQTYDVLAKHKDVKELDTA